MAVSFTPGYSGFSAILQHRISSGGFTFHPRCEAIQLSHVIFAHDMFILCAASPLSFQAVAQTLHDFHLGFVLQPNLIKITVLFAGASDADKRVMKILAIPEA